MSDATPLVIAWCALALAGAGVVKGVIGIGIPIVSLSLLTLTLDVQDAVALLPVSIVLANAWQAVQGGRLVRSVRRFWPLAAALCVGLWAGARLLANAPEATVLGIAGLAVMAVALGELAALRMRIPTRLEAPAGAVAGVLGGLLGGFTAMFGPPIIIYMVSLHLDKDDFVAAIAAIYLLGSVALTVSLSGANLFGAEELAWSAAAAVPLGAGMLFGQWLRARVSEVAFRRGLMVMLVLSGANLVRRALTDLG